MSMANSLIVPPVFGAMHEGFLDETVSKFRYLNSSQLSLQLRHFLTFILSIGLGLGF